MTLLSVLIPSNRPLATSAASLESAIIYAEKTGVQLIVADNSSDPEKRRRFENASPRLTYIDTTGYDARRNLMTTMEAATTPFVLPMGDDDEIYCLDGRRRLDLASLPPDVIGVRPLTIVWTMESGVRMIEKFDLDAPNSDERIRQFSKAAPKNNSIFYSAYRTSFLLGLYKKFNQYHPTLGDYCDWVLVFCLIAAGRILHEPATLFRYDLGRWADKESLERSKLTLFRQAGLPDEAELYAALLRFVDVHGMMMWKGFPLNEDQRQRALVTNAQIALSAFVPAVEANPGKYSAEARLFAQQARSFTDLNQAFHLALPVIERLKPGLGQKYLTFLHGMMQ